MKVAIQGELGSNSHMAALAMLGEVEIVPCAVSAEVLARVVSGEADGAVLPIENSPAGNRLLGSVCLRGRRISLVSLSAPPAQFF